LFGKFTDHTFNVVQRLRARAPWKLLAPFWGDAPG